MACSLFGNALVNRKAKVEEFFSRELLVFSRQCQASALEKEILIYLCEDRIHLSGMGFLLARLLLLLTDFGNEWVLLWSVFF